MNIALCHYRVGETDGVSLEMEKWRTVLERLGHRVFFLAGSCGSTQAHIIPEFGYRQPKALQIESNAYLEMTDYGSAQELVADIEVEKEKIKAALREFVSENQISILVPNNILSLGKNIPAAMAIAEVVAEDELRCIGHHHDFYWERGDYGKPTCDFVSHALDRYFPPSHPLMRHVVINSVAGTELKRRKGLEYDIIPNVFDFDQQPWYKDEHNADFRQAVGVGDDDILVLQATRVTDRKAIELAIDVVSEMNRRKSMLSGETLYSGQAFSDESRIVLVAVGMIEASEDYVDRLRERADAKQVELIFCNDMVDHSRNRNATGKTYSLWDTYVHADIITYPSILEGWGNQFLEALFARKPIVAFEYEVYRQDIKDKGFNIVSLGSEYRIGKDQLASIDSSVVEKAAEDVIRLLRDRELYMGFVNDNFRLGRKHYSYQILGRELQGLIEGDGD